MRPTYSPLRELPHPGWLVTATLLTACSLWLGCSSQSKTTEEDPSSKKATANERVDTARQTAEASAEGATAAVKAREVAAGAPEESGGPATGIEHAGTLGGEMPPAFALTELPERNVLVALHYLEHEVARTWPISLTIWDRKTRRLERRVVPSDSDGRPLFAGHTPDDSVGMYPLLERGAVAVVSATDLVVVDVETGELVEHLERDEPRWNHHTVADDGQSLLLSYHDREEDEAGLESFDLDSGELREISSPPPGGGLGAMTGSGAFASAASGGFKVFEPDGDVYFVTVAFDDLHIHQFELSPDGESLFVFADNLYEFSVEEDELVSVYGGCTNELVDEDDLADLDDELRSKMESYCRFGLLSSNREGQPVFLRERDEELVPYFLGGNSIWNLRTGEKISLELCEDAPDLEGAECLPPSNEHDGCEDKNLCEDFGINDLLFLDGGDEVVVAGSFPLRPFKYTAPRGLIGWFDADKKAPIDLRTGEDHPITNLAFSPDGAELVSGTALGSFGLRFWSPDDRSFERALPRVFIADIAFSEDGSRFFAIGDIDRKTDQPPIFHATSWSYPALDLEGTYSLERLTGDDEVEASPPFEVRRLEKSDEDGPSEPSYLPATVVETEDGTLLTQRQNQNLRKGEKAAAICQKDGLLAFSAGDGKVDIWDAAGEFDKTLETGERTASTLAFEPHSCDLAFSLRDPGAEDDDPDHAIEIWDVEESEKAEELEAPDEPVTELVWLGKDRALAVGTSKGALHLLSLDQQSLLASHREHKTRIMAMAFDADQNLLATGDNEGLIHLWSIAEGELFERAAADAPKIAAAWAPEGGDEDGPELEECEREGVYSTLGYLPQFLGESSVDVLERWNRALDSRILESAIDLHILGEQDAEDDEPKLYVVGWDNSAGMARDPKLEILLFASHSERLEPSSPDDWVVETPCEMTFVLSYRGVESDDDEIEVELRNSVRAKKGDGPWKDVRGTLSYDRDENRFEFKTDADTFAWE